MGEEQQCSSPYRTLSPKGRIRMVEKAEVQESPKKKKHIGWKIVSAFRYNVVGKDGEKNVTFNLGEPLPDRIPTKMCIELFETGHLAKVFEDGSEEVSKEPYRLEIADITTLCTMPHLIPEWFRVYNIPYQSLELLLCQAKQYGIDPEYLGIIEKEMGEKCAKKS
jgi:hypothetical protein